MVETTELLQDLGMIWVGCQYSIVGVFSRIILPQR